METVFSSLSGIAEAANGARTALLLSVLVLAAPLLVLAQAEFSTLEDGKTMVVDDAPDMDVYAFGKSVIVKQRVKGVLAIGGDITIEGSVTGDVATIGGSITQRENAYIGGDVIAFGGEYKPESQAPLREAGKETIMFAALEDELREAGQHPLELFSPSLSPTFFALRVLAILFWFVVSFIFATLAPGAVSRSVSRVRLTALRIAGFGTVTLVLTVVGVLLAVSYLPNYLGASFFLMALVMLMLAFIFGRITLNVSVGKLIEKKLFPNRKSSETLAILFGVVFWTLVLSLPYVWPLAVISLFIAGLGLVLTAKTPAAWRQA